jgi:hypothetical protein
MLWSILKLILQGGLLYWIVRFLIIPLKYLLEMKIKYGDKVKCIYSPLGFPVIVFLS